MAGQLSMEVIGVVSVWFEVFLYGLYCTLFFESLYVVLKKQKMRTVAAKIFFGVTTIMFFVATSHIAVNLYRLLRGYVWLVNDPGPVIYFNDLGRWENIAHDALNAVMTWLGDILLIYRCFIVWGSNYFIIVLPSVLLIFSIVTNSVALHLFTEVRLGTLFSPALISWISAIYAIALAQNTMTTGLIAYRIWLQDKQSHEAGIRSTNSRSSLIPIVRIIVESAVIYVLTAVIIIILYARNNNFQFVIQEAIVPIIGIVFSLISVRLAMRTSKTLATTAAGESLPIQWRVPGGNTDQHSLSGVADLAPSSTASCYDLTPMDSSKRSERTLDEGSSPEADMK